MSLATAIRLGQVVGAEQVVIGSFELHGTNLAVKARTIRLDTGRSQGSLAPGCLLLRRQVVVRAGDVADPSGEAPGEVAGERDDRRQSYREEGGPDEEAVRRKAAPREAHYGIQ